MSLNWRQRQKLELREQLYATALMLFRRDGYEATTVQQITEQAGVAKGTFFNHFPSKEHIVAEWYRAITDRCLEAARDRKEQTAEQAVCDLFADMSASATADPELMLAKFRYGVNPLLLEAEREQAEQAREMIRSLCRADMDRGVLDPSLDLDLFLDMLVAVLTGTSRAWVYTEPRFDFPAVIRQRLAFLFDAARRTGSGSLIDTRDTQCYRYNN